MLKICKKCGNEYGSDKRFYYGCSHHKVLTDEYKLPKDFDKLFPVRKELLTSDNSLIK